VQQPNPELLQDEKAAEGRHQILIVCRARSCTSRQAQPISNKSLLSVAQQRVDLSQSPRQQT
jgi:hypothetical protein